MEELKEHVTIGQYLKLNREKKGISLQQISDSTKIKLRFLQKVEQNNFDDLGGIGYAKAMILTYAKALGIMEDQIHDLLHEQFGTKPIYVAKIKSEQPKKYLLPTKTFSFILLIIVIALLSYLVVNLYKEGILTWPPFERTKTDIKIKSSENLKQNSETSSNQLVPEADQEKNQFRSVEKAETSETVFDDKTDHLNELLFKNKKSPLNYDE
ncbi:MAG: helix-turn-helix domain-containing protein [Candidatus Cloacimonetes bacterium]|nr:helix-turn-helix domain-containing protein [Candidatus Cloacimonadota bacterium]